MKLTPTAVFLFFLLGAVVGLGQMEPMCQNCDYHNFADGRAMLGIPNFWNVVSNLPFFFVGIYGLRQAARLWLMRPAGVARLIPWTLALGVFGVSFGSSYYHWMPENATLIWDRLPMTLMFMALFSLIIHDFLGEKAGKIGFWIAVPFGIFSVVYWHFTECAGCGDLRPYGFVQFFPLAMVPILFAFFPKMVGYGRTMALAVGLYAVAKVAEHFDRAIFETLGFWSGHTIKHLVAAGGLWFAVRLLDSWRIEK